MNAGRDLDALVAKNVFGYIFAEAFLDHYSTDIADAWKILERMIDRGFDAEVHATRSMTNYFVVFVSTNGEQCWHEYGDTAPLTICLAALRALGVEA